MRIDLASIVLSLSLDVMSSSLLPAYLPTTPYRPFLCVLAFSGPAYEPCDDPKHKFCFHPFSATSSISHHFHLRLSCIYSFAANQPQPAVSTHITLLSGVVSSNLDSIC